MNLHVLAIDLGGTKISGAIVNSDLGIVFESTVPSRDSIEGIADPNLNRTKELIGSLCDFARDNKILLSSGCAGFPEYVNLQGELTTRDNIDWGLQPQDDFKALTGFNWLAQSDVRCAGLAEATLGAGRNSQNFVYVTVSSGISHTHFLEGIAISGPNGEAIGFGLLEIEVSGKKVLLENYCSGLGIARRYAKEFGDFSIDAKALLGLVEVDAKACGVVASATQVLGEELAKLALELETSAIVMGGGLWLGSQAYRELTMNSFHRACETLENEAIVVNAEMRNSGVIGAAIYAFDADKSAKI